MRVDPNQTLLELDSNLYKQLEDTLQQDDCWKRIAETLKEFRSVLRYFCYDHLTLLFYRHLSSRKFLELSRCTNPAKQLLEELKSKLYKIRHLEVLLQRCQLYDALAVIADPSKFVKISKKNCLNFIVNIFRTFRDNPPTIQFFERQQNSKGENR